MPRSQPYPDHEQTPPLRDEGGNSRHASDKWPQADQKREAEQHEHERHARIEQQWAACGYSTADQLEAWCKNQAAEGETQHRECGLLKAERHNIGVEVTVERQQVDCAGHKVVHGKVGE